MAEWLEDSCNPRKFVKETEDSILTQLRGRSKDCSFTAQRMIPRRQEKEPLMVSIPNSAKIYGKSNGQHDDDDGTMMVPPHEWLARKVGRSGIASFSMCEGIGRTLKGRDLIKVRDAVLTKTGFLE